MTGISRAEGASVVLRIRALHRVEGTTAISSNTATRRSFAEVLERHAQGLNWSQPLPLPVTPRALPPPVRGHEDAELMRAEPAPDTFAGLLWLKLKRSR
ncbi:hypothetical protein OV207_18425 [Corallococcus sp. BB11-1]|uniref:hypothetical protein n=1 Tax=Corallococcus sp. BB11-1 TaxID=2996783 RepID=UPI0010E42474|nr:hypothetical protein [Corallococcus sp. BB11-1]MCY1033435.1 hypothetical protein [Corallococcus sp. BB11-1]RYZ37045.1 MAG: hypothetical protein EOO72_10795 [Myxococcaceae bacterium]